MLPLFDRQKEQKWQEEEEEEEEGWRAANVSHLKYWSRVGPAGF